jgi:CelD/BcsL family acetyltransferase involved in cellulose biosynthesis
MATRRLGIMPSSPARAYLRWPPPTPPFPFGEPGYRLFEDPGQALHRGVRALGLGGGDEVLVPAWHHGSVAAALAMTGLEARTHDLGPRLESDPDELDSLVGPRVRALILVHQLGFAQNAPSWLAWCRARGLLLVEDASHAWLGTLGDHPLGSFGDLAVVSLEPAGLRAGVLVGGDVADSPAIRRRQAFLLARLAAGDPRARRRANYRTLLAALDGQVLEPFDRLPEGTAPLVLPVACKDPDAMLSRLKRHRVGALDFRVGLRSGHGAENARRLATHTVGLPVHQDLRGQDLDRIVAATRPSRPPAELALEVGGELGPLRAVWTKLAERGRNLFGTWEWASTWWRHFGHDRPLHLVVVRRGAEPIGLLPLYRWKQHPMTVLRFVGHGPADELGPVGDPEAGVPLARSLRRSLHRLDADLLLAEQLPRGQDWGVLLGGRRLAAEASPVVRFDAGGWEAYLRARSANFREQVRRRARKLAREHRVAYRMSDGTHDLDRDLDLLFRLHDARWVDAPTNFRAHEVFHRAFAPVAVEQGWLRLWFLEVDGAVVAALYGFRYAGIESYYQAGRDPAWDHYRVGFVLLAHAIRQAADDGIREYRLLRGAEDYKLRFAVADPGLETVAVARGPLARAALPALAAMGAAPGPLGATARRAGAVALRR